MQVEVEAPSLDQRLQLLSGILAQSAAEPHPSWLQDAAAQTAGLLPQASCLPSHLPPAPYLPLIREYGSLCWAQNLLVTHL